ncbi:hypothetical protein A6R68_02105, partial [Neotoma lepida]
MTGLLVEGKVISYNDCAAQMFLFVTFVTVENYLLSSKACDCYRQQSHVVHHFFCNIPEVIILTCSDRYVSGLSVLVYIVSFNVIFVVLVIWISYIFIFTTILKMQSSVRSPKALSTCASHCTAVSIFYVTIIFMYLQPSSSLSMDTDKITSVFYAIIILVLNILVYSLRNKEVT